MSGADLGDVGDLHQFMLYFPEASTALLSAAMAFGQQDWPEVREFLLELDELARRAYHPSEKVTAALVADVDLVFTRGVPEADKLAACERIRVTLIEAIR